MTLVSFYYFLQIAIFVYVIGLVGFLFHKKSLIMLLISLELMSLGVHLLFALFALAWDDTSLGGVIIIHVTAVCAAEAAIGLAILVIYFRLKGDTSLNSKENNKLKG